MARELDHTKPASKFGLALALLQRTNDAKLAKLVAVPSWLPPTTRSVLSSLNNKRHPVTSTKAKNTARVYSAVAR